ncbi:MAG: hypothetical protein HY445_02915 [Candidatus Niyogibacteria bacterium]|nr:hypothetical protein [Candidatus Niyogibacteria bacterium]
MNENVIINGLAINLAEQGKDYARKAHDLKMRCSHPPLALVREQETIFCSGCEEIIWTGKDENNTQQYINNLREKRMEVEKKLREIRQQLKSLQSNCDHPLIFRQPSQSPDDDETCGVCLMEWSDVIKSEVENFLCRLQEAEVKMLKYILQITTSPDYGPEFFVLICRYGARAMQLQDKVDRMSKALGATYNEIRIEILSHGTWQVAVF